SAIVPEIMDALGTSQKTRAIHHVCAIVQYRLKQLIVILGIVLEIGILNQDDVPASCFKTSPQGCPLAAIFRLKEKADIFQAKQGFTILHGHLALPLGLRLV